MARFIAGPRMGKRSRTARQRAPGSGEHREFGLVFANRAHGGLADRGTRDAERWRLDPHFFSSTWADAGVANWTENQGRGGYAAPPVVAPQYAGESDGPSLCNIGFGEMLAGISYRSCRGRRSDEPSEVSHATTFATIHPSHRHRGQGPAPCSPSRLWRSRNNQVDAVADKPESEDKRAKDDDLVGMRVDPGSDFGHEDLALFGPEAGIYFESDV